MKTRWVQVLFPLALVFVAGVSHAATPATHSLGWLRVNSEFIGLYKIVSTKVIKGNSERKVFLYAVERKDGWMGSGIVGEFCSSFSLHRGGEYLLFLGGNSFELSSLLSKFSSVSNRCTIGIVGGGDGLYKTVMDDRGRRLLFAAYPMSIFSDKAVMENGIVAAKEGYSSPAIGYEFLRKLFVGMGSSKDGSP